MKDKMMTVFKKNKLLWEALLIDAVLLALLLLFFYPRYHSNLDIMMQSILYGIADGTPGFYLMFSNVIVGYVLKSCLILAPACPWYTVFHYACVFLALWAVFYVILQKRKGYMGVITASVIGTFLGYECYIMPGYMRTAALLSAAAVYLMADYIQREEKKKLKAAVGIALAVMGSLISFPVFTIVLVIGTICLIINGAMEGRIEQTIDRCGVLIVVTIVVAVAGLMLDRYVYNHYDYLAGADKYRESVEQIVGYGRPAYDEEMGEALGLEEKEYNLLTGGIFAPKKESSDLDKLQYIAEHASDVSLKAIRRFFKTIPLHLFQTGMFYCCAILGFLLFFSQSSRWKRTIVPALIVMFTALLVLYLWRGLRQSWVYAIVFYPLCMFFLMEIQDIENFEPRYLLVFFVMAELVLYHRFASSVLSGVNETEIAEVFQERESYITEEQNEQFQKNVYYVIDLDAYLKTFSVFQVYPKGLLAYDRMYIADGCYTMLPEFDPYLLGCSPVKKEGWVWLYKPDWIHGPSIP